MDILKSLKKNLFPGHLIERVINRYISGAQSNHCPQGSLSTTSPTFLPTFYFKPPYIGHFITQKEDSPFQVLSQWFRYQTSLSFFEIGSMFGVKDLVYKLVECVRCNACYVDETVWDLNNFPLVWRSVQPVIPLLTFSNINKILNIVAPCVQQIVFVFWITSR